MTRLLPLALGAILATAPLGAFPLDGTYYTACAGEGEGAPDAAEAELRFPELCFEGTCCDLSNPTRLRGLPDQFLYDGACTDPDGDTSEERIFFGSGPTATSIVVVLRSRAATLDTCLPEPPLEDA